MSRQVSRTRERLYLAVILLLASGMLVMWFSRPEEGSPPPSPFSEGVGELPVERRRIQATWVVPGAELYLADPLTSPPAYHRDAKGRWTPIADTGSFPDGTIAIRNTEEAYEYLEWTRRARFADLWAAANVICPADIEDPGSPLSDFIVEPTKPSNTVRSAWNFEWSAVCSLERERRIVHWRAMVCPRGAVFLVPLRVSPKIPKKAYRRF